MIEDERYDEQRRQLVRQEVATVMGLRTSAFFAYLLIALAMLSVAVGAAIAAFRSTPADSVMLFIATTMTMVGVVAAVGAVLSTRGLHRDPLDALQLTRPKKTRAPRNMPAGVSVLVVAILVGILLAFLLLSESIAMASGVLVGFVFLGLIGPASAACFQWSERDLDSQLAEDPALRERVDSTVPIWVHDALTDRALERRRNEARKERFAKRIDPPADTSEP
ncbi:hypothetical protein GCM10022261_28720 [Brevibacterium daeguense]|uniref:Uncharacterized protein n=1 Tax=Brevibacterium daeguense TaxID=909936 RepID=A0ABP8EN64_9MICO|nr:hypothetical protein [Brevibacterium daeguense]